MVRLAEMGSRFRSLEESIYRSNSGSVFDQSSNRSSPITFSVIAPITLFSHPRPVSALYPCPPRSTGTISPISIFGNPLRRLLYMYSTPPSELVYTAPFPLKSHCEKTHTTGSTRLDLWSLNHLYPSPDDNMTFIPTPTNHLIHSPGRRS